MNGLTRKRRYIVGLLCLLALVVVPHPVAAQDDIGNEYRITVFPGARNIHRLNVKVSLQRRILARLQNPEIDE